MTLRKSESNKLGIAEALSARPIQASLASAGAVSVGEAMPLTMRLISPPKNLVLTVSESAHLSRCNLKPQRHELAVERVFLFQLHLLVSAQKKE
jgi:hypothetical protein